MLITAKYGSRHFTRNWENALQVYGSFLLPWQPNQEITIILAIFKSLYPSNTIT